MKFTNYDMFNFYFYLFHLKNVLPFTGNILEIYFVDILFVVGLKLFDNYQNLFDNNFYTLLKTASKGWGHMSSTPTSVNTLDI